MKIPRLFLCLLPMICLVGAGAVLHGEEDQETLARTLAADREAFPPVEINLDADGRPVSQTIRLNDKNVEADSGRYSGFRFKVDRTTAAERQKVSDKKSMPFVWFFLPPEHYRSWYIVPVTGSMEGFENFMSLKPRKFEHLEEFFPTHPSHVIVQQLSAERLVEGQEYIIWFNFPKERTAPESITIGLGYWSTLQKFDWNGVNGMVDSVGLKLKEPLGPEDAH